MPPPVVIRFEVRLTGSRETGAQSTPHLHTAAHFVRIPESHLICAALDTVRYSTLIRLRLTHRLFPFETYVFSRENALKTKKNLFFSCFHLPDPLRSGVRAADTLMMKRRRRAEPGVVMTSAELINRAPSFVGAPKRRRRRRRSRSPHSISRRRPRVFSFASSAVIRRCGRPLCCVLPYRAACVLFSFCPAAARHAGAQRIAL